MTDVKINNELLKLPLLFLSHHHYHQMRGEREFQLIYQGSQTPAGVTHGGVH